MFGTKPRLFSIRTIVVPTLVWLDQLVKLITLTSLNLVGHVNKCVEPKFKPFVLFDILVKPVPIRSIKIATPFDKFQQH